MLMIHEEDILFRQTVGKRMYRSMSSMRIKGFSQVSANVDSATNFCKAHKESVDSPEN